MRGWDVVDAVAVRVRVLGAPAAVALLAVALLAGVETARAQCDPTTMTEGQKERLALRTRDEIVDLEEVKRKIEVEHHVLLLSPDGVILATPEQAGGLFGAAVFKGGVHPDSIPSLIRTIRVITNIYLRDHIEADLKDSRACLERLDRHVTPRPPTTPSAADWQIDWPEPMNWIGVKGAVRGSYVAECAGYRDYPAFRSAGTWMLELLGDGKVRGVFGDEARQYSGLGAIKADGSASGESRSTNAEVPHLKWTAQFQRSGADLVISSHTLDPWPAERGPRSLLVECKPGYMRQE